ncbi:MAG: TIGR03560 family F420-dependent LLM class oxidoreductase [Anaerolineales bacterium]|nr:TIGR03560 family F420-dependent LLM class oxidoreductase [Anaerolineales bacterium]MCB8991664.1 TIGR03560 family F420-dependent LLM class oxidoreductase [Ardenticatenaceae bacterium]
MIEVALMIEGQNGLNWERWQRIAKAADEMGFAGLYRSDHYTNANPPDKDSLELWVSLTWLASHTSHIEFGPLVSPVSFRQPTMTARMAAAVDDLSNGRLILGLGAGWQEREHTNYGWDLLDVGPRFARFEEGLEVIAQLLHSDEPVNFSGDYYTINEGILLPRPQRPGGPPILIGGNGPRRTLPLVAKYASEWNAVYASQETFRERNRLLDELLVGNGRIPSQVRRSLMTRIEIGDDALLRQKFSSATPDELRQRGLVLGTSTQIVDQLGQWAESGVQRIMLQWLDLDNMAGLETLGTKILPQVQK